MSGCYVFTVKTDSFVGWPLLRMRDELDAADATDAANSGSREAAVAQPPGAATPHRRATNSSATTLYLPQVRASLARLRPPYSAGSMRQSVRVEDFSGLQLLHVQVESLNAIELLQEDLAYLGYIARGRAPDGCYVFRHCAGIAVTRAQRVY